MEQIDLVKLQKNRTLIKDVKSGKVDGKTAMEIIKKYVK